MTSNEGSGPHVDHRTNNFYMLGDRGEPQPVTYDRLQLFASRYLTISPATPEGPAALLRTSRAMLAHAVYQYEFVAASASWSIFAVEAALKLRIGKRATFQELIQHAIDRGYWPSDVEGILEAGREIRNKFVHEGKQPNWTFAMAREVIGASFRMVRELYPE